MAAGEARGAERRIEAVRAGADPGDRSDALLAAVDRALDTVDQLLHDGGPARVVDLAWLLHDVAALPGRAVSARRARATGLAGRLAPHTRDRAVREAVIRSPGAVLDHAAAHVVLRERWPDAGFDRLVTEALHDPAARPGERLPHVVLGHAALRARAVGAPVAPAVAPLVSGTALASGIDVVGDDLRPARALVEALAHVTDRGRDVDAVPRPGPVVLAEVRSSLAGALDRPDPELVATLLWAWPLLGRPFDAVARFALDVVLAEAADAHPGRPALALAVGRTAVAALGATARRGARAAVRDVNVERARRRLALDGRAYVAALVGFAGRPSPCPPWQGRAAGLTDAELADVCPLLVDVALRRAVARGDDATARTVLALVVEHGLAVTPAVQQAASVVRRLAIERCRPDAR